ncbi:hypothetical protein ACHAWF_007055 [Thalassiosira exigua]
MQAPTPPYFTTTPSAPPACRRKRPNGATPMSEHVRRRPIAVAVVLVVAAAFAEARSAHVLRHQATFATGAVRASAAATATSPAKHSLTSKGVALVPTARLRLHGLNVDEPNVHAYRRGSDRIFQRRHMSTSSFSSEKEYLLSKMTDDYPWRRRRASTRTETFLQSYPDEKSPAAEDPLGIDDREEATALLESDSSLQRMENGSDSNSNGFASFNHSSTGALLELWGIPIQSVILLNLVAVIWGTQHAVIKSVVDENTVVGLGSGFTKWLENTGLNLSTLQSSVANDGEGTDGDSAAAYFTLARFGLAALLASPYTPGIGPLMNNLKEKIGLVQPRPNNENRDTNDEIMRRGQHGASEGTSANTNIDAESIKLAWKYGFELGIYMFLGYAFQAIGLETTTASRSGFLVYLNVKFVPFLSFFIFGKRIQRGTWISALVAFGGTALLAFDNANASGGAGNGLGTTFNVGDVWSIAAAVASAMFILRMEAASKAVPKSSELNAANLWTVAMLSAIWTVAISCKNIQDADAAAVFTQAMRQTIEQTVFTIIQHPLALIYLSGVTTALANLLQSQGQRDVSAERASVIYAMDPVYGAIFANIILGETLGGLGLAGAFLIFVAAATNAFLDFGSTSEGKAFSGGSDSVKEKI